MITTVYCGFAASEWQSELLAHSFRRAQQPGELVRLVARDQEAPAPMPQGPRVIHTMLWSPHPQTGDIYPAYQKAGALLEWLFSETVDGTILLVEPSSVFRAAVSEEVRPGGAKATAWPAGDGLRRGSGPFGLGPTCSFLKKYCVDCHLTLAAVHLPVLIHSDDLRKIAPRWLELMSLIRWETARTQEGTLAQADEIAYLIAAAEARIPHAIAELGTDSQATVGSGPIIDYRHGVASADGHVMWHADSYRPWEAVHVDQASPGAGQDALAILSELVVRHAQANDRSGLRPRKRDGVREGGIPAAMLLRIPGRADAVSLNSSGAAIWEACDGRRTIADICGTLESRFEMPTGSLKNDVESVIRRLEKFGALQLS